MSLSLAILNLRVAVSEAYALSGPEDALAALTSASLQLAPYVAAGELLPSYAWDPLQEVAENLGLVDLFGQDAVQAALAFGPRVCALQTVRAA